MLHPGGESRGASSLQPGTILGGSYRLSERIGRGAMSEVWRAEHLSLGAPVAVKVTDVSQGPDIAERLSRFHQEARAVAQLRSPHVVQVLDDGIDGPYAYLVMDLLTGETLEERLSRRGRLSAAETAHLVTGIARGLAHAHAAGLLHRDLKPANVFLAREGSEERVKLLDFGIAKWTDLPAEAQVQTHDGKIVGTPSYMSPEQVRGSKLDRRSDLWQVGVIAWECVTGTRPFDGPSVGDTFVRICSSPAPPASSLAQVPEAFDAWLARCLERDISRRFGSAEEMETALAQVFSPRAPGLRDRLSSGSMWPASRRGRRRSSRRRNALIAIGVAVFALTTAIGLLLFRGAASAPSAAPTTAEPRGR
ncbi:MAG: serine/threonine-protein kinase [Polyangiaceae bacterium]